MLRPCPKLLPTLPCHGSLQFLMEVMFDIDLNWALPELAAQLEERAADESLPPEQRAAAAELAAVARSSWVELRQFPRSRFDLALCTQAAAGVRRLGLPLQTRVPKLMQHYKKAQKERQIFKEQKCVGEGCDGQAELGWGRMGAERGGWSGRGMAQAVLANACVWLVLSSQNALPRIHHLGFIAGLLPPLCAPLQRGGRPGLAVHRLPPGGRHGPADAGCGCRAPAAQGGWRP